MTNKFLGSLGAFFIAVALVLQGCAVVQPTKAPETFDQRLAVMQIQFTSAINSAAALITSGRISKEDGNALLDAATGIDSGLRSAKEVAKMGDLSQAENQLRLMQTALLALNARIAQLEKGASK